LPIASATGSSFRCPTAPRWTVEVISPEIIDATEALPLLSPERRRTFERTGIEHFLRATVEPPDPK